MKIYDSLFHLIGKTPLLELKNIRKEYGAAATLLAKLERANPAGSSKDRAALQMILDAEQEGKLKSGSTVIEPTSGNTGIGLASLCAARGYHAIFTMPASMSIERQKLLRAYGAKVVLTDPEKGMTGAIEKAKELAHTIENSFLPGQFDSPSNAKAHRLTTGPEIWEDTDGKIDLFVCAVGTGGTITGCGEFLKGKNPDIHIVAVEPEKSPVLSGGKAAPHGIQGIGAGFIPQILNREIIDEIVCVSESDAYRASRFMATKEGILVGISSGAALHAALVLAQKKENRNKHIVVVLPDTGERYLSTELFSDSE